MSTPTTHTQTIKAVTVDDFATGLALRTDVPAPTAGPGQVLVRVTSSSVNPLDAGIAFGFFKDMLPHQLPLTVGSDFAGYVTAVGEGVDTLAVGDAVFGELPTFSAPVQAGAWAELIATDAEYAVRIPAGVDSLAAGAAGLAGVTALLLIDALELSAGQSVLVVGATGGVGSIAVQLAKAAGATVLAVGRTGEGGDEEFLLSLGVDEVIARGEAADVLAAVHQSHPEGVDSLIDLATAYQPTAYDGAVREGGRISSATSAAGEGEGRTNVMHAPTGELLTRVAAHLADGTVRVPVQRTLSWKEPAATLGSLQAGGKQGKTAVVLD